MEHCCEFMSVRAALVLTTVDGEQTTPLWADADDSAFDCLIPLREYTSTNIEIAELILSILDSPYRMPNHWNLTGTPSRRQFVFASIIKTSLQATGTTNNELEARPHCRCPC